MPVIGLPTKPDAPISYTISNIPPAGVNCTALVVFLNGLGLPAASWDSVVESFQKLQGGHQFPLIQYDRFGQGSTTAQDPSDKLPEKEVGYGHDFLEVVKDLHELLQILVEKELDLNTGQMAHSPLSLVFVASSIGAHIARLYASQHPNTVAGMLILDSNIGNKEYTDLWPDPYGPNFSPDQVVSDDCTLEQYIQATKLVAERFNTDVKNPESLDRRNLKRLLPEAGAPKLIGPDNQGPWLTVVGHDPEAFADEGLRLMKTPRSLTRKFTNPAWRRYNEELLDITEHDRQRGVIIAPKCGHFIQKDDPDFVAVELDTLLRNVKSSL